MKRVLSIACLLFSFTLAVSLSAQTAPTAGMKIASDADYATHMKEIGQLNGVLNKSLKAGEAAEAGKAAARMEVLFKNVHTYWADKKIADATTAAAGRRHLAAGRSEGARVQGHGGRGNGARGDWRQLHVLPHGAPGKTS